ncbi:MAG: hypothetical protein LBQ39_01510 [Tannerellaceae bacterium]|nr:hypothetical protein [Tannerellaceae bacterium]
MHTFPKEYAYFPERVCILFGKSVHPLDCRRCVIPHPGRTSYICDGIYRVGIAEILSGTRKHAPAFVVVSWSFHGHCGRLVAVWWSFGGRFVVISWSFGGHLVVIVVISWSFRGHLFFS